MCYLHEIIKVYLYLIISLFFTLTSTQFYSHFSKPGDSSIQILLLAVRNRWRGCGIGQYLLSLCKDPAIVGHYDLLLTYADHKAEQFFSKHGFTDDPIITARHK